MTMPKINTIPPLPVERVAERNLLQSLKSAVEWLSKNSTGGAGTSTVVTNTIIVDNTETIESITRGNTYYPNSTEADQGQTGGGETFKAYAGLIGSKNGTLFLKHDSGGEYTNYIFDTDLSLGSNIAIQIEQGARIYVNSGSTLTIGSIPQIGINHAFFGDGFVNVDDSISITGNVKITGYHEMAEDVEPSQGSDGGRLFVMSDSGENHLFIKFSDGRIFNLTDNMAFNHSLFIDSLNVPAPSIAVGDDYAAGSAYSDSVDLTVPEITITCEAELL